MKKLKYFIGAGFVTVGFITLLNLFPVSQVEAQNQFEPIYTLYEGSQGTYCCCPGSMDCGAACCSWC